MCQKNYNIENKELKLYRKNINRKIVEYRKRRCNEIAVLLNKSIRTIQRGLVENLTTNLESYVYKD